MKLVPFPVRSGLKDVPAGLRALADAVERGDFVDAHNLAWVMDCGDGRVELGMLGQAAEPGATSHLLFCVAAAKIEAGVLSD